jgi:hypothetical protein
MKKLLPAVSCLCLAGFALSTWSPARAQDPAQQTLEARVAALEGELALEKKRHEETRALLDQSLAYLERQSKAAQTLMGVLDESEKQGFAWGENWRSREILLAGFRAYWGGMQGAPKAPEPPPEKPAVPARPTRQPARQ